VKLSALLPSVTVMLPRIPLGAGGKGVDDCKEELGDSFSNWWLERQREAIQVLRSDTYSKPAPAVGYSGAVFFVHSSDWISKVNKCGQEASLSIVR